MELTDLGAGVRAPLVATGAGVTRDAKGRGFEGSTTISIFIGRSIEERKGDIGEEERKSGESLAGCSIERVTPCKLKTAKSGSAYPKTNPLLGTVAVSLSPQTRPKTSLHRPTTALRRSNGPERLTGDNECLPTTIHVPRLDILEMFSPKWINCPTSLAKCGSHRAGKAEHDVLLFYSINQGDQILRSREAQDNQRSSLKGERT